MDFEDIRRGEIIEYVKNKYGADHVSNIITFGTLAARNVIRDVARTLDTELSFVDKLAKSVPAEVKMTLDKAYKTSPDFKNYYDTNETAKKIIDIAKKLEGLSKNKSQHACGVIVANAPIRDYVPEVLMDDKNNKDEDGKPLKTRTAAFNKEEVEELGLLKMDFLGLRNMTIEHFAIDSINERFFND